MSEDMPGGAWTVESIDGGKKMIIARNGNAVGWLYPDQARALAAALVAPPDEPPLYTILRDKDTDFWVRFPEGWYAVKGEGFNSWSELQNYYGPLTVVHRP